MLNKIKLLLIILLIPCISFGININLEIGELPETTTIKENIRIDPDYNYINAVIVKIEYPQNLQIESITFNENLPFLVFDYIDLIDNTISFSGIIPNGISEETIIGIITFNAQGKFIEPFYMKGQYKLFLNDGLGTEIK